MTQAQSKEKLLEIQQLVKHFPSGSQPVRAVDGVSFHIYRGETLGLVGESGCGKSTTGRLTLRLLEPTSGAVHYNGTNVLDLPDKQMKQLRKEMQIIFQDPYSSLDPRKSIGETIMRPLVVHKMGGGRKERMEQVVHLMEKVGLDPRWYHRYPHELDGGRRQRVGIARALALNPKYIVCDEPVSALDVSVQAQVINLMQDLQEEFDLTYLFISHDLSVVKHVSNRIAVMYLGEIVELAESEELFHHPLHPYTKALLSAVPSPSLDLRRERIILQGDVPSPKNPPSGCRFHTRCPFATELCQTTAPQLAEHGAEHFATCHYIS